jgi:hypothetical protein
MMGREAFIENCSSEAAIDHHAVLRDGEKNSLVLLYEE